MSGELISLCLLERLLRDKFHVQSLARHKLAVSTGFGDFALCDNILRVEKQCLAGFVSLVESQACTHDTIGILDRRQAMGDGCETAMGPVSTTVIRQ